MTATSELLAEGRHAEAWKKHCGFLDLNMEQFMQIQKRLLLEQIDLLFNCELGRHFLGSRKPTSIEEFREIAPLTRYPDYISLLSPDKEHLLPAKPLLWMRTSGRTGHFGGKQVPCPPQFYAQIGRYLIGTLMLASAKFKGDVRLVEGDVFLYTVAPPPYISGTTIRAANEEFPLRFVPTIAEAEQMGFQERIQQGFLRSMDTGIDYFVGLASVLVRIGEAFSGGFGGGGGDKRSGLPKELLRPRAISRLVKALFISKLQKRPIVPKDIWSPKGMVVSGMDVQIYRKRVEALWGTKPIEAYACTEFGTIALQAWGAQSKGLTLAPESAFWEFMPEAEYRAWGDDATHQPKTLLLDQVTPGRYVLVGTSLAGGAFVRYVIGDMISVISLRDSVLGIELPQIVMESRVDDIIDLGSLTVLTERGMWQALGEIHIPITDWIARKEFDANTNTILHLYIEESALNPTELAESLHNILQAQIDDYAGYVEIMATNPIRVSVLTSGTFQRYMERKQAEGADLGHLKPPRMQPSEQVTAMLLSISHELAQPQT